ncbi:MAG: HAMP domain-containing protein, partial [Gemmatimonadaceae bacterium]|nr:HAMP domain-containing protein [Gemmatimonadaceae bacterium]
MTFRARLLAALGVVALVPLAVIAVGVRREMTARLTAQDERRVAALAAIAREELAHESASIAGRLAALGEALVEDNRFRLGAVQGASEERTYVRDYAERAMRTSGLAMLQIQDDAGRIVSSGHFRNEFDRLEPDLPALLATAPGALALVRARTPDGPLLALARVDSVHLGGRTFTLVGGVAVDERFLRRLARADDLAATLALPDGIVSSDPALAADSATVAALADSGAATRASHDLLVAAIPEPYIGSAPAPPRSLQRAMLLITHPLGALAALRRSVDRWFLTAIGATALIALLAATWLAARMSRPLRELAATTERIDLDRLDVHFPAGGDDEIGALARLLGAMTRRLRAGAASLREAERRAAVGDLARQVNHDIKNGLAPIRNVLRHLTQVAQEHPEELPRIFAERRHTLETSITYLDTLARNYARLTPRLDLRPCDANALARDVAGRARTGDGATLRLDLAGTLPAVAADPVVLRRIMENLVDNAIDSLDGGRGTVTISTATTTDGDVRLAIADTGCGMTREELARAFDDFYTTKAHGTGLGLSIVRRLVTDLHGALRIDTAPGAGTTATVTLPAHASAP